MIRPPILRTGRTAFSLLVPSKHNSHPLGYPLLRLPATHRSFHASPKPQLINTILVCTHDFLTGLHTITHLPWAATLPLSALIIRVAVGLPLALHTRRNLQQQFDLQPLILSWTHHFRRKNMAALGNKGPVQVERAVNKDIGRKRTELYRRWKCQWWKSFSAILQLPIWLAMVETLRAMSGMRVGILGLIVGTDTSTPDSSSLSSTDGVKEAIVSTTPMPDFLEEVAGPTSIIPIEPSLATEGALWFPNLTVPDPMLILPFALSAVMLLKLYYRPRKQAPLTSWRRRLVVVVGMMGLAIGPLTLHIPSAMLWYWFSSLWMGFVQDILVDRLVPWRMPPKPCQSKVGAPGKMNKTGERVTS